MFIGSGGLAHSLISVKIADGVEALKERALWMPDEGLLAVADLHLGYEGVLRREGVVIPRRQKAVIMDVLERLVLEHSPQTVLVNGDFKHDFSRNLDEEWYEVKEVLRFLKEKVRLVIVRGNHDNYLPNILRDMGIELRKSYKVGNYVFTHGHWDIKTRSSVVIGHEHPSLKLRDGIGAVLSVPAFVVGEDFIVMPAFSPLALGSDVSSYPYLSPVLRKREMKDAKVFGADEREGVLDFGTVSGLRSLDASLLLK